MNFGSLTYGNSARDLAVAGSILAGVLLLVWLVRAFATRKLRNASTTDTHVDDVLLDIASRTRVLLLLLPALYLGARALRVPPELFRLIRAGATLTVAAQMAFWATGMVEAWISRYRRKRLESDPASLTTLNVFRIGSICTLWIAATLVAFQHLGFNVTTLVAGLGIGGIAVALATQNILGDLFASLSIVIDKPFVVGDAILVDGLVGSVENIGLKSTQIRALSGEQVTIGNADLLKSRVHNFRRMAERRVEFRLGVTYQTPHAKLQRIPLLLQEAVEKQPGTRFDRGHLTGFGESSLDFEAVYWVLTSDYKDYADIHHEVCLEVIRAFEQEQVEFAYPTRTLLTSA